MDFWKKLFKRELSAEDYRKSANPTNELFLQDGPMFSFFNRGRGASGKSVTEDTALTNSTVYACFRILTQSISTLPIHLYRRKKDGSRSREENHPLEFLMNDTPNPMMTTSDFVGALQYQLLTYNTAYAEVIRNSFGEPIELWPLLTKKISLEIVGDEYKYVYTHTFPGKDKKNVRTFIDPKDLIVIKGVTQNGKVGVNLLQTARDTIGTSLAADEVAAASYQNTSLTSGALKAPADSVITEQGARNLIDGWSEAFGGPINAGKVCFLHSGVEFQPLSIDLDRLQLLETRKFQVRDIARIYGVPLHMLADPERQSFNSNEQQALDFVSHTLRPWLVCWEQALGRALLTPTQRKSLFFEFNTDSILRGDISTRYNAYQLGIQNGWLSPDEVRIKENMAPIPGKAGNQYLLPMNMENAETKLEKAKEEASKEAPESPEKAPELPEATPDPEKEEERQIDPSEALLEVRMNQIKECERVALTNILEKSKSVEEFTKKITKFAKNHLKYVEHHLNPFVNLEIIEKNRINEVFKANLEEIRNILEDENNDKMTRIQSFITSL